mmetsp:Transcript_61770/g.180506  ORF Transcript_61770/g.180506 Transcript_61770/m.180506 type:complete len:245 (+) Transcript_61770:104-838(+)
MEPPGLGTGPDPLWVSTASLFDHRPSLQFSKLTLWCVDESLWRAECIRLCLFSAGVSFNDHRASCKELVESGKLRFGTFPVLEVNGRLLTQTTAIAEYVGKLTGFYPEDPWLAAKVEEILGALADATDLLSSTLQEQQLQRRMRWRQHLISEDGRLMRTLGGLEDIVAKNAASGVSVGKDLTVADFAIWRAVGWISTSLDGIPHDFIATNHPHLWQLHKQIDSLACVKTWKDAHPHHYSLIAYA